MGLEYMEYKIGVEETSLREKYGKDDLVIKDPLALQRKGWAKEIMDIYLVEQNVKLDLVRFRRKEMPGDPIDRLFHEGSCHYIDLSSSYTRHQIINLDEEKAVHCFPSAIIGLISHSASIVDPTLQRGHHPKTLHDFRSFIAATYSKSQASHAPLRNETNVDYSPPLLPPSLPWRLEGRPRLVLLNRKGTRTILNIDKVYQAVLEVGFDAVVYEPSREASLHEDFRLIDSSHALIAVHGTGLTNMLFLRKGSVLMQLAPKESDWLGSLFYGKMAVRLGLEYMVYDLGEDESLLGMDKATKERLAREGGNLENWVSKLNFNETARLKKLQDFETEEESSPWESPEPTWSITCDRSHFEYDLCYINRPSVLHPTTATLSAVDPTNSTPPLVETIRPYPRKWQHNAMETVREVTLTTAPLQSPCAITHTSPALIFSAGGFTSNVFHDFNEGFIPLFITVDTFFNDQDVILAIVNCSDWWVDKYSELIARFTRHPIINLDKETATHCFPTAIVGLMSHGPMTVDPTLQRGAHPKTVLDFHAILTTTYGQGYTLPPQNQPKLVIIGRSTHRVILNQDKVLEAAKNVGFDVVVFEPTQGTPMREVFRVLHSSHVMIGVHGAGLTNELFLRPGAVFMQIVPIRNSWLGDICYGKLALRLGLEYIVYDIAIEESSLANQLPKDLLDPNDQGGMLMNDWANWEIYMNQNVTLNLARFGRYLERAYEKAKISMQKESSHADHWSKIREVTRVKF
ncbi:hypothetical protein RHMOL_Rhmol12G0083900 [Rhododendron molle]|uniref:Uncharacterized protein n=1 Tax=Rhododendron molle TaxID=49168 RepID=A0ACC0LGN4_RHOML|nr:hypothetical protein RHMOL_Rhmol12G0083900 [Rhododendron molle]